MEIERGVVEKHAEELARLAQRLWRQGVFDALTGSLSVRVKDAPLRILMSASGVDKATIGVQDFVVVDGSGVPIDTTKRVSSAARIHIRIYAVVPGAGCVIQAHPPHVVALTRVVKKNVISVRGLELARAFAGVKDVDDGALKIPVVANEPDIDRMATAALAHREGPIPAIAFAGHGAAVWGADAVSALRHLEALEAMARVLVLERSMG